eukprot:92817-Pelagomonas_calceolata.AAC.3
MKTCSAAETHWPLPSAAAAAAAAAAPAHWEGLQEASYSASCRRPTGTFFTHTQNKSKTIIFNFTHSHMLKNN